MQGILLLVLSFPLIDECNATIQRARILVCTIYGAVCIVHGVVCVVHPIWCMDHNAVCHVVLLY